MLPFASGRWAGVRPTMPSSLSGSNPHLKYTHPVCISEDVLCFRIVAVSDTGRGHKQREGVLFLGVQQPALHLLPDLLHALLAVAAFKEQDVSEVHVKERRDIGDTTMQQMISPVVLVMVGWISNSTWEGWPMISPMPESPAQVQVLLVAPEHCWPGLDNRLAQHVVQIDDLITALVPNDDKKTALPQFDTILHHRPDSSIDFLPHFA